MADNPDIQWALELLEPYEEKNPFYKHGSYIFTFICGTGAGLVYNWWAKRPMFAGVQMHLAGGVITAATIGTGYKKFREHQIRERAAITRDYIIRHPEDFKQAPYKTIGDVLESWTPIR